MECDAALFALLFPALASPSTYSQIAHCCVCLPVWIMVLLFLLCYFPDFLCSPNMSSQMAHLLGLVCVPACVDD